MGNRRYCQPHEPLSKDLGYKSRCVCLRHGNSILVSVWPDRRSKSLQCCPLFICVGCFGNFGTRRLRLGTHFLRLSVVPLLVIHGPASDVDRPPNLTDKAGTGMWEAVPHKVNIALLFCSVCRQASIASAGNLLISLGNRSSNRNRERMKSLQCSTHGFQSNNQRVVEVVWPLYLVASSW